MYIYDMVNCTCPCLVIMNRIIRCSVIMKKDYGVNQIRIACFGNHLLRSVNAINQRLQETILKNLLGFQASGLCDERLNGEHFINQRDIRCFPNRTTLNLR